MFSSPPATFRAQYEALIASGAIEADRELAGAAQVARWLDALAPPLELAEAVRGRVVLLVVDATSSGWSVTVAARALRQCGARDVLPLLVHRRP